VRAHRSDCGWFWTWAAVGFGLVLSFVGIFSVGPFLLPVAALLLGVAAARRVSGPVICAGVVAAAGGVPAALLVSQWIFLVTPLVTLAIGVSPAVARTSAGVVRAVLIAAVVAACAVAAQSASPSGEAVLVIVPLALAAFALAVAGRLRAEATGAVAGAGAAAALLGGPPAVLLLIVAGLAAFPLLRGPAGPNPLPR
jgi:hypothetical protein